jgi:hypothetical protein
VKTRAQRVEHAPHHRRARGRWAGALPLLLALPVRAQAVLLESCQPGDSDLVCRLRSVLTLLEVAAAILCLVLVVAIVAAVRAYRRKPRKVGPEDLTTDAK